MNTIPVILFILLAISAEEPGFTIKEEHVTTTINADTTVHFWYHFTIHTTEGPQRGIYLGIPTDAVREYTATQAGKPLKIEKELGRLKIWFLKEAQSGDTTELQVRFTAEGLLYRNNSRAVLEFYPCWWERQSVDNLRVTVVLPKGCPLSEVESSPATDTSGTENESALFYEKNQLDPGYKLQITVSFPHQYITPLSTTQTELPSQILWVIIGIAAVVIVLLWIKKQKEEPAYGETLLYDTR